MEHMCAPALCPSKVTRSASPPYLSTLSRVHVIASETSRHMVSALALGKRVYVATHVTTPSSASLDAMGANCHFSPTAHTPPWTKRATGSLSSFWVAVVDSETVSETVSETARAASSMDTPPGR